MRRIWFASLLCGFILGGLGVAEAATITASADGNIFGLVKSDRRGPATAGALLARVAFPEGSGVAFLDSVRAMGAQDVNGVAAALAQGAFINASPTDNVLDGRTSWSETITNTEAFPVPYLYVFTLHSLELLLRDFAGISLTNPLAPIAEYAIDVRLNGNSIFASSAILRGGSNAHELVKTGVDLGGTLFTGQNLLGYSYPEFTTGISLGTLQPNESLTVDTSLRATTHARLGLSGARAMIGDPLDLKHDPGISSLIMQDELIGVEPSSWGAIKSIYRTDKLPSTLYGR